MHCGLINKEEITDKISHVKLNKLSAKAVNFHGVNTDCAPSFVAYTAVMKWTILHANTFNS